MQILRNLRHQFDGSLVLVLRQLFNGRLAGKIIKVEDLFRRQVLVRPNFGQVLGAAEGGERLALDKICEKHLSERGLADAPEAGNNTRNVRCQDVSGRDRSSDSVQSAKAVGGCAQDAPRNR